MSSIFSDLKNVKKQYLVFLITLVLTIVTSQVIIQYDLNQQNEDAKLINIAGRQRTLSQRIVKICLYIHDDLRDSGIVKSWRIDTLQNLITRWEKVHLSLSKGSSEFGISDRRSARIDSLLEQTGRHLYPITDACKVLLNKPDLATTDSLIEIISRHERPFLTAMEKTVNTYQQEAEEKLNKIKNVELALAVSSLIILLLEFLYLFRPMIRKIEQNNGELNSLNNELASSNEELRASEEELKSNLDYITALQENLSLREKQYREVIETATDMIYELNHDGFFAFTNKMMEKITGFTAAELKTKRYWEIIDPSWIQKTKQFYKKQRDDAKELTYFEVPIINKQQETIWVGQNVRMHFENKYVRKVSVIARDITELKIAYEKLAESERQYRLISTNAKDLITVYTAEEDPKRVYISPSVKQILGYEPEELIGKSPFEIIVEEDANRMRKNIHPVTMRGGNAMAEYRIRRKDGKIIWLQSHSNPFFDENGNILGFQTSARDITEEKNAELALRASEQRFRILASNAPIGIFQTDAEGRCVFVNKKWCEISGIEAEAALGDGWAKTIIEEDRPFVFKEWSSSINNGTDFNTEFRLYNNSKGPRLVHSMATRVTLDEQLVGYMGTMSDITELRQAQQKLLESEKLYRELLENSLDLTTLIDDKGHFIYASSSSIQVLGYDATSLTQQSLFDLIHPQDKKFVSEIVEETLKGKSIQHLEFRLRTKGRSYIWVDSNTQPVISSENKITSIQLTSRDITLKKEAEAALKEAKQKAEEATLAKSQFLSMMSHEIRTPMNAIIGLTHLLLQDEPRPDQVDSLNLLKFSGENLLTIINDILDFNKIEAGKITLEKIDVDLYELLWNTIEVLKQRAESKGITVFFTYESNLPHVFKIDPVRVSQIITNLVGNAIKFTEKGYVHLSVVPVNTNHEEFTLKFAIKDSGIGIPPDKINSIFDSFSQATADTTRKFGGTGLGLSITKRLLQLMGSEINVTSEMGKGSEFTFSLKLTQGSIQQSIHTSSVREFSSLDVNVLLVEDNRVNQIVATNFLKRWGMKVEIANHGKEALEKIRDKKYALVLMDLQMPEMDGYETSKAIRSMNGSYYKNIPIVALTASAMLEVKSKVLASGMNDSVSKPFQPTELYEVIAHHISNQNILINTHFSKNLDVYADGNPDFKRELAGHLIKNVEELEEALKQSITTNNSEIFEKTVHKVKTSLAMLGDQQLIDVVESLKKELKLSRKANEFDHKAGEFSALAMKIKQGLQEEINPH